jgi:putative Ca2+/H+ antiporter (TMEM165/GDT1 family)
MRTFWLAFGALFVAELGDKTQLAVITLTAQTQDPWRVFLGAVVALAAVSALGALFGEGLLRVVPEDVIKKVAAGSFVVIGALMFAGKL